jgi:hypothetical protein
MPGYFFKEEEIDVQEGYYYDKYLQLSGNSDFAWLQGLAGPSSRGSGSSHSSARRKRIQDHLAILPPLSGRNCGKFSRASQISSLAREFFLFFAAFAIDRFLLYDSVNLSA